MSLSLRPKWQLAGALALTLAAVGAREAAAQNATVTGKVTNTEGAPLAGAVVAIRDLATSAATNVNGVYTITVQAAQVRGQTVVITARSIGFASQTKNIVLSPGTVTADFSLATDPLKLDELVVTGVSEATSTKKLSFAVGKVDEETIQNVPAANPLQALTGKVSGARVVTPGGAPGAEAAVRLRSATSLTPGASQQPLLVVDGVITKGTLADLNAQDIENIEILKGAASAGIYGSDAAGGVINVMTKRGKSAPDGKTVVTLRNEVGFSKLPKKLDLNESSDCPSSEWVTTNGQTDYRRTSTGSVICNNRSIFFDQPFPAAAPWRYQQDNLLGNGIFFTNYLGVGRRMGGTNFSLSGENTSNDGIIDINSANDFGFKRQNIRLNVDQVVSDKIDFSAGGFYNTSNNVVTAVGAGSPFFSILFMPGDVDLNRQNTNGQDYLVTAGRQGATPSQDANPLYTAANQQNREDRTRIQGNFRGRYRPTEWLSFEGTFGYDRATRNYRSFTDKGTLQATGAPGLGNLTLFNGSTTALNAQVTAILQKRFDQLNTIFRASYLYEDEANNTQQNNGTSLTAVGVPQIDNVPIESRNATTYNNRLRAKNVFGQLSLDFKDRYILDGMLRSDNSSLFGADERSRTFYRISGAWRVTQDIKLPGIDELRLRASRGTAGLRPPFEAQYETFVVGAGSITPGVLGNKNLKPAYSEENEFGGNIEFGKRFVLEYTYSTRKTFDQILPVPLPGVAGFSSQWRNAAQLDGNTHELAFGALLVNSRDVNWRLNVTWDRTRQTVAKLDAPPFQTGPGGGCFSGGPNQTNCVFIVKEGETFGAMYGTRWAKTFDDLKNNPDVKAGRLPNDPNAYVVNPEGLLVLKTQRGTAAESPIRFFDETGNSNVKIGDANPDFQMGFNTTVTWKGLALYGLVDWTKGGDIYNLPRQWLSRSEFRAKEVDQRGRADADKVAAAFYGRVNDANGYNDFYVENGTFARLRELRADYTFNRGQLKSIGIDRVFDRIRVGVVGRNLVTWTDYSGMDPETSSVAVNSGTGTGAYAGRGDATTFRFDAFGYPNFRTFSLVLDLGF